MRVRSLEVKGVILMMHPACEPISFLFDRGGRLRDLMGLLSVPDVMPVPETPFVSVKTQFAPVEVHITIIKLLQYFKKRYVSDMEVLDEGEFWETGDERRLREKIAFLDRKIAAAADALSSADIAGAAAPSPRRMADVVEDILRRKLSDEESGP